MARKPGARGCRAHEDNPKQEIAGLGGRIFGRWKRGDEREDFGDETEVEFGGVRERREEPESEVEVEEGGEHEGLGEDCLW